jgi:hypothetical protein
MPKSMTRSTLTNNVWYRNMLVGNPPFALSSVDLISTTLISTNTTDVTFSNLGTSAAAYKHLQLRIAVRTDRASTVDNMTMIFNADTATNYSDHYIMGDGSAVSSSNGTSQSNMEAGYIAGNSFTANGFGFAIIDILDFSNTSKNKTIRSLTGLSASGTNGIMMMSGLWRSTSAVTSITLDQNAGTNFVSGSRFSLYGIKG